MSLSIRLRLTLLQIFSLTLLTLLFSYFIYRNFSHAIYDSSIIEKLDAHLLAQTLEVKKIILKNHGPYVENISQYKIKFNKLIPVDLFLENSYAQLRDFPKSFGDYPSLIIKSYSLKNKFISLQKPIYNRLLQEKYSVDTINNIWAFPLRIISMKVKDFDKQEYILQLGMSMRHIDTTMHHVFFNFFLVIILFLISIAFLSYYFIRKSFTPILKIIDLAKNITAEDFSHQIKQKYGNDELGVLARTLNEMLSRLETSFKQIKQFSDDVSHELKTPLTAIKGEIEVTLRKNRSKKEYKETLHSLLEENNKLEEITENLFFLSRIEMKNSDFLFSKLKLNEVILEAYKEILDKNNNLNVTLQIERIENIDFRGNQPLLKRLIINLLTNAIRYNSPGGSVIIELIGNYEDVSMSKPISLLRIKDTGIGISKKALPFIFDRFYQVDKSRSRQFKGSGLGLTIVKKIVDLHQCQITVKSQLNVGTTFSIYFPNIKKI